MLQDTWAQNACQNHPPQLCVDGRGGESSKTLFVLEPPLCSAERLRALSLLLVIPFLHCCSQVIVSSCCSEIFSHRVTIAFTSQMSISPLLTHRGSIPKHRAQVGRDGGRGGSGGLVVWSPDCCHCHFRHQQRAAHHSPDNCCCNAPARARYLQQTNTSGCGWGRALLAGALLLQRGCTEPQSAEPAPPQPQLPGHLFCQLYGTGRPN